MTHRLVLLPGNHTLERELFLYGAETFSMESQYNETVVIECASQSARFVVQETIFVSIKGLHFIGCAYITVTAVEELVIEDTIFQGVEGEGGGTALVLDEVKLANICKNLFDSNTPGIGNISQRHIVEALPPDIKSFGGALLTTSSNVSVTDTKFVHNTAELGGVLLAYESNITITQCTYSYNRAHSGGVMFTVESSVTIDSSTFSNNAADEDVSGVDSSAFGVYNGRGGVMFIDGGSVAITNSTFANNTASGVGGVMDTYGGPVTIMTSTFVNNTAAEWGGVMIVDGSVTIMSSTFKHNTAVSGGVTTYIGTDDGSLTITNSTFTHNTAADRGGVLYTASGSVTITRSTFTNITADKGGVVYTFDSGSLTITSSTFTNNAASAVGGVMAAYGGLVTITSSTFVNNTAAEWGGVMITEDGSVTITSSTFKHNTAVRSGVTTCTGTDDVSLTITNSTFTHNTAANWGGVLYTWAVTITITSSTFKHNTAVSGGVATYAGTDDGSLTITNSTFTHNTATDYLGGVLYAESGSITIESTTFKHNTAADNWGGVLYAEYGSVTITSSTFKNNTAYLGGVLYIYYGGSLTITSSTFANNTSSGDGGVILIHGGRGSLTITSSTLTNNTSSRKGGVMCILIRHGSLTITSSTFANNTAFDDGGAMDIANNGSLTITSCTFTHNTAYGDGGALRTFLYDDGIRSFSITSSAFSNNKVDGVGGVIWLQYGSLSIYNSTFTNNTADDYGGIMFTIECSTNITHSTFRYNTGSLYTFSGSLTVSGQSNFENCVLANKTSLTLQEGGAVTSYQSTVIFNGETRLLNNQAKQGGAMLATESTIMINGVVTIANNTATESNLNSTDTNSYGGGISLRQSELEIKGSCTVSDNYAVRGGGVHAKSSTITVRQQGTLQVVNNNAGKGGGMYLEVNPKLYLLETRISSAIRYLLFSGNQASYGGAVYVADDTNAGACSPNIECFIQTLALYQAVSPDFVETTIHIHFSGNIASTGHGPNLFGGLLDRCVPSSFAEVYQKQPNLTAQHYNGVSYLQDLSNIEEDSISSPPVRICFCTTDSEPDCSYQPPPIKVKKGETFNVSLVAVDQVNRSVDASIVSSLASPDGGFGEGQQTQPTRRNCTDLTFNVFSSRDYDSIDLYAEGPCGNSELSVRTQVVEFLNCTCPVGFQPSNSEPTRCQCICDQDLSPYITNCNSTTNSIIREHSNSWITYINDTDPPGYVIHPNCPFDYCKPQTLNVSINLNLRNGADAQCANNRTSTLCGACQEHLSLSLGSSHCLPCSSHWPAAFVTILLAAIVAGILLVTAVLALNMTVAGGLINSFIFYANIVSANSAVFFPSSEPSFPTVFVAWLNLDLGIDVCFLNGLDTYTKTWLQLAFPVYIISLVVIVILISEYSPRFAQLIAKRDPVATLATLILLSYAKLLSTIITVLSFAVIYYPDGAQEIVWLPDGNVKYTQGKHAALVIAALLIILVGVPYTILLLLWQWIVRVPRWKVFNWTRNTKLNAFIAAYHAPYNSKHRYWTGLLLLVRVVLFITASLTVSDNPQVSPLAINTLVGAILVHKCMMNLKVYRKSITDIVETMMYFNLLVFAVFSLFYFKTDPTEQVAVAYTSTSMTFLLLLGVIAYHLYIYLPTKKQKKTTDSTVELDEYALVPQEPIATGAEVSYSVVEVDQPQGDPPEPNSVKLIDYPSNKTLPYN